MADPIGFLEYVIENYPDFLTVLDRSVEMEANLKKIDQ